MNQQPTNPQTANPQMETIPSPPLPIFSGVPMHDYFCRMIELSASSTMPASSVPQPWREGPRIDLPATYSFAGQERPVEAFFQKTDTAALLVLKSGHIRYERYALTGGRDVPWISMSVAKSFISALVGIAIGEGAIASINDPISTYIAVEPGSAYDGATIRDVLQMSSGGRWNEDYHDPESDIFRLSAAYAGVGTFDNFIASCVRERAPGTVCRYNSADTQALGTLITRATGRSVASYMHQKLLEPLGLTSPSHWLTDPTGREAAYMGLNMTARDFARLGELYRNGGVWNGRQIVPRDYVAASIQPSGPHTQPGQVWVSDHQWELGYGYQWWVPAVDPGEFSAIGVYNQLIYVHPGSGTVIVKLSANRTYGSSTAEHTNHDIENVAFVRAIARHVGALSRSS